MSLRISEEEGEILQILDAEVRKQSFIQRIDGIVKRVEAQLSESTQRTMAWEPVPLDVYGHNLPGAIGSSWVFVLRANITSGAERHPNSIQRMVSYRGEGDLQTWSDGSWRSNKLTSDFNGDLDSRWLSVPINVWHQVVVPDENWVVVSFHSVPANELIEERTEDPANMASTRRKKYIEE